MYPSAYDLKDFYNTPGGRAVCRILRQRILEFWPAEQAAMRVMGMGYALPYLKPYLDVSERVFNICPAMQGAHHWPAGAGNLACLSHKSDLPVETSSIDRILMVHSLEFSGFYKPMFEELWRVLKSSGRLMIIVPNRMGLWARADWTPFGQGTPFSATQVENFLRDHMFSHERTQKALFMPPFRRAMFLKSAAYFEKAGRQCCPALGGVHIVEASKQLYAGIGKASGERVKTPRSVIIPQPAG